MSKRSLVIAFPFDSTDVALDRASMLLWCFRMRTEGLKTRGRSVPGKEETMALEKELETYRRKLPELTADEGKFALIRGEDLVGVFGTYEDALKEGYSRFKLEPFLVQQIQSVETIHLVTRLVECECLT